MIKIKPREMDGDFDSMPRAYFISERARRKYFGEDETPDENEKKENA